VSTKKNGKKEKMKKKMENKEMTGRDPQVRMHNWKLGFPLLFIFIFFLFIFFISFFSSFVFIFIHFEE
jgi:magnesium-transporting ATPase (P-type)